jgi:hypothetical protein
MVSGTRRLTAMRNVNPSPAWRIEEPARLWESKMQASLFILVPITLFFVVVIFALLAKRRFRTSLKIPFALLSFEAEDDQHDGPKPR